MCRVADGDALLDPVGDEPTERDSLDDDRAGQDDGAREHGSTLLAACN